ncbi:hypothetical protein EHYA_02527 [Embleya hyalina]|uniref:Uncharacterized protein n=1 Tax=Embleya hyalina TaxID=516124 RepID=A0A401YJV0_9ACTN|nr:hypothetical protein EHYA_02527 [Embleya hyalina]
MTWRAGRVGSVVRQLVLDVYPIRFVPTVDAGVITGRTCSRSVNSGAGARRRSEIVGGSAWLNCEHVSGNRLSEGEWAGLRWQGPEPASWLVRSGVQATPPGPERDRGTVPADPAGFGPNRIE